MKKLKKDLITARELKTAGKNRQAFEIYEKCYKSHPEEFSFNQKNDYAWTIYKAKIQYYTDEDDLLENARYITELVEQLDFNKKDSCAYTAAVFKILNHFKNKQDFPSMIPWLEKLNPDLLDEKLYRKNARFNKSHKELYFDWSSKAYYL